MADFTTIFFLVSRGSALSLELYQLTTTAQDGKFLGQVARATSNFSLALKQVGTLISQDDSLPSAEAIQTLDDIFGQCSLVLDEIKSIVASQDDPRDEHPQQPRHSQDGSLRLSSVDSARLGYLQGHLESLKCTIDVMLQTLYTAQSIMWARTKQSISPQQADRVVNNEKAQLESLIIEQQMSILMASRLYDPSRPEARLLMEKDSSQSLTTKDSVIVRPADLFSFQETFISSLDASDTSENDWLPAICGVSRSHLERLLERWTRLQQLHDEESDKERKEQSERRETQQPTVESDSDEETRFVQRMRGSNGRLATPTPRRPGSIQPLFEEMNTLPIPVPNAKFGPAAPISPVSSFAGSPRSSIGSLPIGQSSYSPVSPRSSIASLPVEAAAAVDAKDKHDDIALEIPWRLISGSNYWDYVDDSVEKTNTDLSPSHALADRKGRTEILALWVCKEALEEAGLQFSQGKKALPDGRRTKLETCFCIEQPLPFEQVQRLVERTVELYRENRPPSPPPQPRRSSFDRNATRRSSRTSFNRDRDRTPLASLQPPPLQRSTTTSGFLPPPPPLDRSLSLPGPVPTYPPAPPANPSQPQTQNKAITTLHLPIPQSAQAPHQGPYSPQHQQSPYSPQYPPYSPVTAAGHGRPPPAQPIPNQTPFNQNLNGNTYPPSPLRHSFSNTYPHPQHQIHPQTQHPHPQPYPQPYAQPQPQLQPQPQPHPQAYQPIQPLPPPPPPRTADPRLDYSSTSTTASDSEREHHYKQQRREHRSKSRRPSHNSSGTSNKKKHSTVGTLAKVGGLAALLDGIVELGVL